MAFDSHAGDVPSELLANLMKMVAKGDIGSLGNWMKGLGISGSRGEAWVFRGLEA